MTVEILVILFIVGMFANIILKLKREAKTTRQVHKVRDNVNNNPNEDKHLTALYQRGYEFETGYNEPKSLDKAMEFYTLAAEQGLPAAQYKLASLYTYGRPGQLEVDLRKARYWVVLAIKQDYAGAQELYHYIDELSKLSHQR